MIEERSLYDEASCDKPDEYDLAIEAICSDDHKKFSLIVLNKNADYCYDMKSDLLDCAIQNNARSCFKVQLDSSSLPNSKIRLLLLPHLMSAINNDAFGILEDSLCRYTADDVISGKLFLHAIETKSKQCINTMLGFVDVSVVQSGLMKILTSDCLDRDLYNKLLPYCAEDKLGEVFGYSLNHLSSKLSQGFFDDKSEIISNLDGVISESSNYALKLSHEDIYPFIKSLGLEKTAAAYSKQSLQEGLYSVIDEHSLMSKKTRKI